MESKYRFIVGVPPMPFTGNLLQAKIVILTLNPGYVEEVNKNKCMAMKYADKKQLLCLMRNALNLQGEGIMPSYLSWHCYITAHRLSFWKIQIHCWNKTSAFDDIHQSIGQISCDKDRQDFPCSSLRSTVERNLRRRAVERTGKGRTHSHKRA